MTTKNVSSAIALLLMVAGLNSCKKDQDACLDNSSMDNESISSFVEKTMSDDEDAVSLRAMMGPGGEGCGWQYLLPECALVTESSESFPKTITIDYGDGCTNSNGVTKSGIITIQLSDDMMNEGAVRSVTFDNFFINQTELEGSRITTNLGIDEEGHPVFSRVVDVTFTKNNQEFQRQSEGTVTWLSGHDTPDCGDNMFEITGSGIVVRPNGTIITRTIVEPLLMDRICGYITSGTVEINTPQGTATIDFGNGECDDTAVATDPMGNEHIIELHH